VKNIRVVSLVLLAVGVFGGSPLVAATPCPFPTAPLTMYLAAGFSCTVGDDTFSGFSYSGSASGNALVATASDILVGSCVA